MTRIQEIIEGLQLIRKYEPRADFAASHDEIQCGDPSLMTDLADRERMKVLAWRITAEDSWAKFV